MKGIKSAGPVEISAVRRRALRSLAMERITQEDCEYITSRCDEIAVRIESLHEKEREEK